MLIEFTVGNFRSFKEPVTFSMVAANLKSQDKTVDENNTFEVNDKLRLLRSAVVYGANGSGKSNLAKAMQFMRIMVMNSSKDSQADDPIPVELFRLSDTTLSEPSFFQIVFIQQGTQYRYGFEVTGERVTSEWLFAYGRTKEANLFQRDLNEIHPSATKFKEGKGLKDKTRKNALFLSVVAQFNGSIAQDILTWFRCFNLISGSSPHSYFSYSMGMFHSSEHSQEMQECIHDLDLSIQGLVVDRQEFTSEHMPEGAPEALKQMILMHNKVEGYSVQTVHDVFDHSGKKTGTTLLNLDEHESDGTQKLVALAGPIVNSLRCGKVLFVDELDARLHPLITRALIRMFSSPKRNPLNAQLIFATHDINLLDKDLFRRDQIWFAEKNRQGATKLYSLAEFRVRNDSSSLESDYIHGKFGAIPFLGDLNAQFDESEAVSGTE